MLDCRKTATVSAEIRSHNLRFNGFLPKTSMHAQDQIPLSITARLQVLHDFHFEFTKGAFNQVLDLDVQMDTRCWPQST